MGRRPRRLRLPVAVPSDHDVVAVEVEARSMRTPASDLLDRLPTKTSAPNFILVAAAIGAALNPLNSTMVAVALPALSAEFGASASSVTLTVVTGYLVATLVSQVPAGSVADRVGYPRALGIGRLLFLAGALAGTLASSLWVVVAGRLLMAVGGSLIIPTAMALVRVAVSEQRRARAFGTLGAVLGGAAAVGPALGAWMLSHFGWRSLFVINVPMVIASYAVQWVGRRGFAGVTARQAARSGSGFDWIGSLLIGITLVLLTFATRATAGTAGGGGCAGGGAVGLLFMHESRGAGPRARLSPFGERP